MKTVLAAIGLIGISMGCGGCFIIDGIFSDAPRCEFGCWDPVVPPSPSSTVDASAPPAPTSAPAFQAPLPDLANDIAIESGIDEKISLRTTAVVHGAHVVRRILGEPSLAAAGTSIAVVPEPLNDAEWRPLTLFPFSPAEIIKTGRVTLIRDGAYADDEDDEGRPGRDPSREGPPG